MSDATPVPDETLLTGEDRIEPSGRLGRPIRKGAPEALAAGDATRLRAAIEAGDAAAAVPRLHQMHALARMLVLRSYEWVLQWPAFLSRRHDEDTARAIATDAVRWWHGSYDESPGASPPRARWARCSPRSRPDGSAGPARS